MISELMEMDIVLQGGPISQFTVEIAKSYAELAWVKTIIVSCWESCSDLNFNNSKVKIVKTKDIPDGGITNRNRQIVSTLNGLKQVKTEFSAKFRTDQEISLDSMNEMYEFYQEHKERKRTFTNNEVKPYNRICVASIFKEFPFHPRDHWFWGNTKDLIDLFSIPLELGQKLPKNVHRIENWLSIVRSEVYISQFYCAKFDSRVKKMIENPLEYLVDRAPNIKKAFKLSKELMDDIFKVFPRVHYKWPKYYGQQDLFDFQNPHPDYYHGEEPK